jgi:hypothetical protein
MPAFLRVAAVAVRRTWEGIILLGAALAVSFLIQVLGAWMLIREKRRSEP